MIGQSQVALADVVVIKKDFMSIDFGYFAFVIGHNENGEDEFIPFFGDHYSKDFMVNWIDKVDPAETLKMNIDDFKEIMDFPKWGDKWNRNDQRRLWCLFNKNFPDQCKLYRK